MSATANPPQLDSNGLNVLIHSLSAALGNNGDRSENDVTMDDIEKDRYHSLKEAQWLTVVHPGGDWILYGEFDHRSNSVGMEVDTMEIQWTKHMPASSTVRDLFRVIHKNPSHGIFTGLCLREGRNRPSIAYIDLELPVFEINWDT